MVKTIAVVAVLLLVVVLGVVLAYAATRPDVFRVQRTASIKAPPDRIFPLINDFRRWSSWSPYERKDPAMKKTYSGAAAGTGAVYAWEGDRSVGSGRIEIADTAPPNRIAIKLDMIKPFAAHNRVEFMLEPKGESTEVTWAMNGHTPYLAKIMHVFLDMDRMVGRDFEAGLASLKALAEK
jgi:hypothetical protein